jgi:hypothetical protein
VGELGVLLGVEELDDPARGERLAADARALREMKPLAPTLPRVVQASDRRDARVAR